MTAAAHPVQHVGKRNTGKAREFASEELALIVPAAQSAQPVQGNRHDIVEAAVKTGNFSGGKFGKERGKPGMAGKFEFKDELPGQSLI
ncbi:hypothetical protein SDC9_200941 [bioreactor metagenome]|uniref:Uncharacterized protein n=1 Tax=bioreactor metagenome TaxID=1076179 RepID=A0A645IPW7_9ZZZZ